MGIRPCALQSKAFLALKEAYEHREKTAEEWRTKGKKVMAELGCDVPDELLIAADVLPIRVYADSEKKLKQTNIYLEYAFDPIVRAQFEKIVDGTYKDLADALIVSNSTDVLIRIYLYLRELHRTEPEKPIPSVRYIDWLFTRNRLHQNRNELIIQLFIEELERLTGEKITNEAIEKAAEICNEDRQALCDMAALREGRAVRINGCEAMVIIGSAFFMERDRHAELVRQVVKDAADWPVIEGVRVFLTGSNQEDLSLYEMIEETGAVIVGEDHDWGDRFFEREYNMDLPPVRALVDCYMLREFSSKKAFVSQRVQALDRWVERTGAEAVIFYTNRYEEAASWDYPSQKENLDARHIPSACFAKMQYPVSVNQELKQQLENFVHGLKGGCQDGR